MGSNKTTNRIFNRMKDNCRGVGKCYAILFLIPIPLFLLFISGIKNTSGLDNIGTALICGIITNYVSLQASLDIDRQGYIERIYVTGLLIAMIAKYSFDHFGMTVYMLTALQCIWATVGFLILIIIGYMQFRECIDEAAEMEHHINHLSD